MINPTTTLIRRGTALAWLEEHGVSEADFDALVQGGAIRRQRFTENGRYYYFTADIRDQIVAPLNAAPKLFPAPAAASVVSADASSPSSVRSS